MKKKDVQVGKTYRIKVSGKLARVRLDRENPYGGWVGTNLATGRKVRIKTAARLRGGVAQDAAVGNVRLANVVCAVCGSVEVFRQEDPWPSVTCHDCGAPRDAGLAVAASEPLTEPLTEAQKNALDGARVEWVPGRRP